MPKKAKIENKDNGLFGLDIGGCVLTIAQGKVSKDRVKAIYAGSDSMIYSTTTPRMLEALLAPYKNMWSFGTEEEKQANYKKSLEIATALIKEGKMLRKNAQAINDEIPRHFTAELPQNPQVDCWLNSIDGSYADIAPPLVLEPTTPEAPETKAPEATADDKHFGLPQTTHIASLATSGIVFMPKAETVDAKIETAPAPKETSDVKPPLKGLAFSTCIRDIIEHDIPLEKIEKIYTKLPSYLLNRSTMENTQTQAAHLQKLRQELNTPYNEHLWSRAPGGFEKGVAISIALIKAGKLEQFPATKNISIEGGYWDWGNGKHREEYEAAGGEMQYICGQLGIKAPPKPIAPVQAPKPTHVAAIIAKKEKPAPKPTIEKPVAPVQIITEPTPLTGLKFDICIKNIVQYDFPVERIAAVYDSKLPQSLLDPAITREQLANRLRASSFTTNVWTHDFDRCVDVCMELIKDGKLHSEKGEGTASGRWKLCKDVLPANKDIATIRASLNLPKFTLEKVARR